jgi:hypothetical protein
MGLKEIRSERVPEKSGGAAKSSWETMQLVEVGSVAALMQSATGSKNDGGTMGNNMMVGA